MTLLLLKSGHCSEKVPVIRAPQKKAQQDADTARPYVGYGWALQQKLVVQALEGKAAQEGRAWWHGNLYKEVRPQLAKHVAPDEIVACSEAGLGLTAAWADLEISAATARHHSHEFAPMKRFRKNGLSKGQLKVVAKAASMKKPAAVWSPAKQSAKVLAGDNVGESAISNSIRQMRRLNLLGRNAPNTAHMDVLMSRRLLRKPGLVTVLSSLAAYRRDRAGHLACAPQDFGVPAKFKDKAWLFE